MTSKVEGYEDLYETLMGAYQQSAGGKGHERHADGRTFAQQPIMLITEAEGDGFPRGQALKKIEEAKRLPPEMARNELRGAIVYLAAAIMHLETTCDLKKDY